MSKSAPDLTHMKCIIRVCDISTDFARVERPWADANRNNGVAELLDKHLDVLVKDTSTE